MITPKCKACVKLTAAKVFEVLFGAVGQLITCFIAIHFET